MMITANEARKLAMSNITNQVNEYITNYVTPAIEKAANQGNFTTTVGLKDLNNAHIIAKETVKVLNLAGFDAKHVYCNDQRDYENHLSIKWEVSR